MIVVPAAEGPVEVAELDGVVNGAEDTYVDVSVRAMV